MKTTIVKKVEQSISVKEIAEKLISELEEDPYKVQDMAYSCVHPSEELNECLFDYVYSEIYEYDPTDEEVNEVYQIVLPKLKEMYNKESEVRKEAELSDFSNRQSILSWIAINIEDLYFVTPEEVLDTILKNGTKSRS